MTAVESTSVSAPPASSQAHTRRALTPPVLAGLVALLGVDLWIVGCAVHTVFDSRGRPTSLIGELFPLWHLGSWVAAPYALLALAVAALLGLAARPELRPPAAGALAGIGVEGYLLSLPGLAIWLAADQPGTAGWALLTLGGAVVVCAGALLHARAEPRAELARERPTGLPLAVTIAVLLAALALLVSTVLPVYDFGSGGTKSPLALSGVARWLAAEPAGVGLAGVVIAALAAGGLDRASAGGALAGLGFLASVSELSNAVQFSQGAASVQLGTWVALAGAACLAATGVVLLTLRGREEPVDAAAGGLQAAALEPTRHLSAAAHLDAAFARRAVRDILRERHRAIAPSSGVQLGTVLRHCVAARGRSNARDVLLLALALPLLVSVAHLSRGALVALAILALAWLAVLVELWTSRYRVAAQHLGPGGDCAAPAHLGAGAEARIREIERCESGNLVVYSGYSPYVGTGQIHGGWSFAINARKGKEELAGRTTAQPFGEDELHRHVATRLRELELPTLVLADRLYVDGERVRDDDRFLPDRQGRPRTGLSEAELRAADAQGPPDVVRRLRSASVTGWGGELIVTIFLEFVLEGPNLFADATYCLLTPPDPRYRSVDGIDPHPGLGERVRVAAEALRRTVVLPLDVLRALPEAQATWRAWRRRTRERREIARNPRFDYGATTSLRELAQAKTYRRHFQNVDRDMFAKVLEHAVLDAIVTFLDDHGVDTSELQERQSAVLNNGVIVTGGALSAQSLAVGQSAQSSVVRAARRAAAKVATGGS